MLSSSLREGLGLLHCVMLLLLFLSLSYFLLVVMQFFHFCVSFLMHLGDPGAGGLLLVGFLGAELRTQTFWRKLIAAPLGVRDIP